jgi:NADPH:quinone reductase-like Zn-dependent oxidoreductase
LKAVRFHRQGGPEVLVYEDAPNPQLGDGEALMWVKACGVNRVDIWARNGRYKTYLPHILGTDVAGEVIQVSQGVSNVTPGSQVVAYPVLRDRTCRYCITGRPNRCEKIGLLGVAADGGYAEYVKVRAEDLLPIRGLDFKTAAAIPVNFGTAWNGLVTRARVKAGDFVLVWAAGSGLGYAAVQVAKLFGAKVIATAGSDAKVELAMSHGADYTINHSREDVPEKVRGLTGGYGADIVFDHVGAETWQKSIQALAKGGVLVSVGVTTGEESTVNIGRVYRSELTLAGTYAFTTDELTKVLKLASQRRLAPHIYKELPLRSAGEAHRILEAREQFGKILLIP